MDHILHKIGIPLLQSSRGAVWRAATPTFSLALPEPSAQCRPIPDEAPMIINFLHNCPIFRTRWQRHRCRTLTGRQSQSPSSHSSDMPKSLSANQFGESGYLFQTQKLHPCPYLYFAGGGGVIHASDIRERVSSAQYDSLVQRCAFSLARLCLLVESSCVTDPLVDHSHRQQAASRSYIRRDVFSKTCKVHPVDTAY